jgi:hypothetical protein
MRFSKRSMATDYSQWTNNNLGEGIPVEALHNALL